MATPVDEYKSQCGQLSDYLWGRQEPIINQWAKSNLTNEARYIQAVTNQLRGFLYLFTQRITDEPKAREPVEPTDPYEFLRWPGDYTLAEVIRELTNFYAIVDLEIQQFLALYSQTQAQVIGEAYRQLGRLSNEVTTKSVLYLDHKPLPTRQTASPHPPINPQPNPVRQRVHDLRASFGIIASAAGLLALIRKDGDRVKYLDMITRNVTLAEQYLHQLLLYVESERDDNA